MALRLLIILVISLSSCTSIDNTSQIAEIFSLYKNQAQKKEIKVFNRSEFSNIRYPLIEVKTSGILIQALMLPLSERDGYRNYTSGSGQNITLKNHHIVRTNGMDIFLNSSEVKNSNPISRNVELENWPKEITREYKFLTPLFTEYIVKINCDFKILQKEEIIIVQKEYYLNKIIENCYYKNNYFENNYWAEDNGFIWKSKQWLPHKDIFLEINLIKNNYN